MLLEEKYNVLLSEYDFEIENNLPDVSCIIRDVLQAFVNECKIPAIWCYGEHTKMLMTDFMNELKPVKFIIDEYASSFSEDSGFKIISSQEIEDNEIDGIIISSFKFRNEIKQRINKEHSDIRYLDLYDYFEEQGIVLGREYYVCSHPYSKYTKINKYKLMLLDERAEKRRSELLWKIIGCFVEIKDFFLAIKYAEELCNLVNNEANNKLLEQLKEIYNIECRMAAQISEENVLMLCLDGLRNKDILSGDMPGFKKFVEDCCYHYTNAYSVSTSTYESLVPAYGENLDMKTKYYESNCVSQNQCRFVEKAKQQGRQIYFYTDFTKYVDDSYIIWKQAYETATEKIWSFIIDAVKDTHALFYVHILYESHYSYPSPYIDRGLIAEGTSIIFDFLGKNGGRIRTDYEEQHRNTLRYLDDVMLPFLRRMKCRMVIYADHGNIIFNQNIKLEDLQALHFTYHDDLIRIPFMIKSPEMGVGVENKAISLMELNEAIICLMEKKCFVKKQKDIIKLQRSAIYNPDFQYLYKKCGQEQGLKAFEAFVFKDQSKLAVYENGYVELAEKNVLVDKKEKKRKLFKLIKDRITVCDYEKIVL